MSSGHDFNYRVALASGLRSLQGGRPRHAQEEFRYLVRAFPRGDDGYRGLAMVQAQLGDQAAALETLRAGASTLAKAGERSGAIALLREAVQLAPRDLPAHRRLGAALALAGDTEAAILEYRRFIQEAVAAGDVERAGLEARYAVEVLPGSRDLSSLREAAARRPGDRSRGRDDRSGDEDRAGLPGEALSAQRRAAELIRAQAPGAAGTAIEAARRLLDEGRAGDASDLLLDAIAAGIGGHEAQVLLVEVAHRSGRQDAARTKSALLARKLRLEGEAALAEELDRLSRTV